MPFLRIGVAPANVEARTLSCLLNPRHWTLPEVSLEHALIFVTVAGALFFTLEMASPPGRR